MQDFQDTDLLRSYARHNSEAAFSELVRRHIGLVYSAALRQVNNPAQAEEITQAVFIILARKAALLRSNVVLDGWLYETTRFTALSALRAERRRLFREQEAFMRSNMDETDAPLLWNQLAPLLEEAIARLGKTDRDALVLRFFKGKSVREVATVINMTEAAAQRRILRALEKLRKFLARRGINSTAGAIGETIAANSIQAAPIALAKSVTAVAVAKGAAGSASTLTLIKGALKLMAWTKTRTTIVTTAIVLLMAAGTTATVKDVEYHQYARKYYTWQVRQADFGVFYKALPQISILPTRFEGDTNGGWCADGSRGAMGIDQPIKEMAEVAYQQDDLHTVAISGLPTNRYDFLAKLVGPMVQHQNFPQNEKWAGEFQKAIAKQLGVTGRFEMRNTDVWLLRPVPAGVHGFKTSHGMPGGIAVKSIHQAGPTSITVGNEYHEQPVSTFMYMLQFNLKQTVVDDTGLTNSYDFSFTWTQDKDVRGMPLPDIDELNPLLTDQLGLELVSTNMPVRMLVVEKVK